MEDKVFDLISKMYQEMQEMKKDFKQEMQGLREEMQEMKQGLREEMQEMKQEIDIRFDEVNQKLDTKADKTDIVRLENVFGDKISGLFDARELQLDTNAKTQATLERIEGKLDKLNVELDFLNHRERETERDVFSIKRKLEIIR